MMYIDHFVAVGLILFIIGFIGVIVRKNVFIIMMSIELMLNAVNLILLSFGYAKGSVDASTIALLILAISAAEAAFGFVIVINIFKNRQDFNINIFNHYKGD